jgi:hypothetical protein
MRFVGLDVHRDFCDVLARIGERGHGRAGRGDRRREERGHEGADSQDRAANGTVTPPDGAA